VGRERDYRLTDFLHAARAGTLSVPVRMCIALAAGAVIPLAFSPFFAWPLAPLAIALALHAVHGASARVGFVAGYVFGIAMFGVGVGWIHESFQYNNVHGPVVWVLSTFFVAFLALFPAAWGALVARCQTFMGPAYWWLGFAPAIWVLVEWVRGWFLTGFTWLQVGVSQTDGPAAGLAPLVGAYGLGWFVAATGGALAWLVLASAMHRASALVVGVLSVAWLAAYGLQGAAWTEPAGDAVDVALVQGNFSQDIKWRPENRAKTLARYKLATEQSVGARLVVWPETAIPILAHNAADYLHSLGVFARANGMSVLVGAPYKDLKTQRYYNSMLSVGLIEATYHKRHLVPFGEYLPFEWLTRPLLKWLAIPAPSFTPWQEHQAVAGAGTLRLGITICYEAAFGSEVIKALPDATLLVNVSNDAWFGDSLAPLQHLQITRMRALESGRFMVRATNTGVTAIIDPFGQVVARAPQFEVATLRGTVVPMTGLTPYAVMSDWPAIVLVSVLALFGVFARKALTGLARMLHKERRS
jgi:apolipoprotein N-acyltransferase